MGKKEQILLTLDGKYTGYIPVIPVANTFAARWSGKPMGEVMSNSELYAQAVIDCRKHFDYDGLWVNGFGGVAAALGQGLTDKFGQESLTGEGVILTRESLEQLHEFRADQDLNLDGMINAIRMMKEQEPDQPIFTVVSSPASTAAVMMDVGNFYISMIKDPEFVKEVIRRITEPLVESVKMLARAGVDVIWNPMPTLSGTCISRKLYEQICRESNMYFNEQVRKCGLRLVAHACGKWDDRFDLLFGEGNDGVHVSECNFQEVCQMYGKDTCIMGDIPSVPIMLFGTPEEVYQTAFGNCMEALSYGTFILSPDCGMPPDVPYENIEEMCRAARDAVEKIGK